MIDIFQIVVVFGFLQKCIIFCSYRNINAIIKHAQGNFGCFIGNFGIMPDITYEIKFKTARSGGKGGQNVNKVETMVEGYWNVAGSSLFTPEEKERIAEKLKNKINLDGLLLVKSQAERSQLGNKQLVIQKMNDLVTKALIVQKARKPTKVSKAARLRRLESKQKNAVIKQTRRKPQKDD
jgi:ribosome-associated protein